MLKSNKMQEVNQKQYKWTGECPFENITLSEWEEYRNRGSNFVEPPMWCSLKNFGYIRSQFEKHGYILFGQFTNNANNSVYFIDTDFWFQITTLLFIHKSKNMYVEFTMDEGEHDPSSKSSNEPFQYKILYDINIYYFKRTNEKFFSRYLGHHSSLHGVPNGNLITGAFFTNFLLHDPFEQDIKKLVNDEFFGIIIRPTITRRPKTQQTQPVEKIESIRPTITRRPKTQPIQPVEKIESIYPFSFQYFKLLRNSCRLPILVDLLMKMNRNEIVKDRFDHLNVSYYDESDDISGWGHTFISVFKETSEEKKYRLTVGTEITLSKKANTKLDELKPI